MNHKIRSCNIICNRYIIHLCNSKKCLDIRIMWLCCQWIGEENKPCRYFPLQFLPLSADLPLMDRCYILLSLILHDLLSFSQSFRFLTGYVAVKSLYCPYTISTYPVFSHHEQSKVCFLFFNRHCKIFNHLRTPNLPFLLLCSILFLYSLGVILYLSLKTRLKVL